MTESIQLLVLVVQAAGLIVWDLLRTPGVLPAILWAALAVALTPALVAAIFPPETKKHKK